MNFTKIQGAGNDFVLIDASGRKHAWTRLARAMCDRHFGIGADGLLLLLPSDVADFRMRMLNPDGSEAETCGNGIRCLAKYVLDKGLLMKKLEEGSATEVLIETMAGVSRLNLKKSSGEPRIQTDMGTPKFEANDIPVAIPEDEERAVDIKNMLSYPVTVAGFELKLNFVSMGNPHAVCFWEQPIADFPLAEIGPQVEHLKI